METTYSNINTTTKLSILDLRLWIHLGCSDEEKKHPQPVNFNIELTFTNNLKAMLSDCLNDAVCYAKIAKNIEDYCKDKKFNLIEHLTKSVAQIIEESLDTKKQLISSVKLIVHKINPPIPNLLRGVTFEYFVEYGND